MGYLCLVYSKHYLNIIETNPLTCNDTKHKHKWISILYKVVTSQRQLQNDEQSSTAGYVVQHDAGYKEGVVGNQNHSTVHANT